MARKISPRNPTRAPMKASIAAMNRNPIKPDRSLARKAPMKRVAMTRQMRRAQVDRGHGKLDDVGDAGDHGLHGHNVSPDRGDSGGRPRG